MTTAPALSEKQLHVLNLIAEGMTDKDIAQAVGISVGVVAYHCTQIYDKLGAKTRAHAVAIAMRQGVIK